MLRVLLIPLLVVCLSSAQVLASETPTSDSTLESRQGFLGLPLASPSLGAISGSIDPQAFAAQSNIPFLQQQNPYASGLANLGGLQGYADFQGLAELQELAELQGLAQIQSLPALNGLNGQGLQDSQNGFMRRFGPFGLGNNPYALGTLGLRSPVLNRFGGVNPALLRGVNPALRRGFGGQDSLRDILDLNTLLGTDDIGSSRTGNSLQFPDNRRQTPTFLTETNQNTRAQTEGDKELTALLETLSTLQLPRAGLRRLSDPRTTFLGRGGRFLPGLLGSGLRKRTASLQPENESVATQRIGTPENQIPDELSFQEYADTPYAHHRQEDVETDSEVFRFPHQG